MQERRTTPSRRRAPPAPPEMANALGAGRRRAQPRRMPAALLAALAGTIESVAATAGPVVEATAEAARGEDLERQYERLAVALRNLEAAMAASTAAVRAALHDLETARGRLSRRK